MNNSSKQGRLQHLFKLWCDQTIERNEITELIELLETAESKDELDDLMRTTYFQIKNEKFFTDQQKKQLFLNIVNEYNPKKNLIKRIIRISSVAAIFLLVIFFAGKFILSSEKSNVKAVTVVDDSDILPPTNALGQLKTDNGRLVDIQNFEAGIVADLDNVLLKKRLDGSLFLDGIAKKITLNTITVPKGSQPLHLSLSDGTTVLLNVESTITFPNNFKGSHRSVSLIGEAYFEVKHDPTHPFIVRTNKSSVRVLGTHFNVRSYMDDKMSKITLTEGRVNVDNKIMLKPGQQAIVKDGKTILDKKPDMGVALAWKNNEFVFESEDMSIILSELAKWYNFDLIYNTKNIPHGHFSGSISKNSSLSSVFKIIESTDVHFKIEHKKVIVY